MTTAGKKEESADLCRAKRLLDEGYTCAIVRGETEFLSRERGILPLLRAAEQDLAGCSAADTIVGRAAAFLYLYLGARSVYASVMSEPARELLLAHGVACGCGRLAERIVNRAGDGPCPMDRAVAEAQTPAEAYARLSEAAKRMGLWKGGTR